MRFEPTQLEGVVLVRPDLMEDQRGFFARLYCPQEFAAAGIAFEARQTSLSRNDNLHTLRGMHYCNEPEAKLVRCVRGRILDVVFDIRRESATFGKSVAVELSADNALGLYIAPGLAHGFLTLEANSDVMYQIDRLYRPGFDAGLRWNDPQFAFDWPAVPAVISERDATYPDFTA
jgi:dTDP-4-dehydrorhamnose 3,5-epimerase